MKAVELNDELIAALNDEQVIVLQELGELAAKKLKLTGRIKDFSEQISSSQRTMGFQTKDDPEWLHEDPEVVSLITIKERYKLGNIRVQVRRALRRAVDVGLGHLAIIQRQCRNYGIDCSTDGESARRYFSDPNRADGK